MSLQPSVSFNGGNSLYTNSCAIQYIIDTFDWTFTDGGLDDFYAPDINSLEEVTYELGSTGNEITWNVEDFGPNVYNVTKDGVLYVSDNLGRIKQSR